MNIVNVIQYSLPSLCKFEPVAVGGANYLTTIFNIIFYIPDLKLELWYNFFMIQVFSEVGFGNDSFLSTEFENSENGEEYRKKVLNSRLKLKRFI